MRSTRLASRSDPSLDCFEAMASSERAISFPLHYPQLELSWMLLRLYVYPSKVAQETAVIQLPVLLFSCHVLRQAVIRVC